MKVLGLIPARLASTRFPKKPMATILGMPMVEHIYHRSESCNMLDEVFVATCDNEIFKHIIKIGGSAVMTSDKHERASERTAEALLHIEKLTKKMFDIVVMIQGDEPLIIPEMIEQLTDGLIQDDKADVANLMQAIDQENETHNPNNVKVVTDLKGYALYYSREPIPSSKKYHKPFITYKQLGLIAFRRQALLDYVSLEQTNLEIIESVDMNRYLEYGYKIKMINTDILSASVDTPADLAKVIELMKKDAYVRTYIY